MTLTGVLICLTIGTAVGGIYGYLLGKGRPDDPDWWESL